MGPSEVQSLILGRWVDIVGKHHDDDDRDGGRGHYGKDKDRDKKDKDRRMTLEEWQRWQREHGQYPYGQQPYPYPQYPQQPRPQYPQQPAPQPHVRSHQQGVPQGGVTVDHRGGGGQITSSSWWPFNATGTIGAVPVSPHAAHHGGGGPGSGTGRGRGRGFGDARHRDRDWDRRRWRGYPWWMYGGYPPPYGYGDGVLDIVDNAPEVVEVPVPVPTPPTTVAVPALPPGTVPDSAVGFYGGHQVGPRPAAYLTELARPDSVKRFILPMSTGVPILPTQSAQITGRPQGVCYVIERCLFSNAGTPGGAADWICNDIKIGNQSQFIQSGDVPGDMFATNAIDTYVSFQPAQTAMDVVLVVTYIGSNESGAPFYASMLGKVAI